MKPNLYSVVLCLAALQFLCLFSLPSFAQNTPNIHSRIELQEHQYIDIKDLITAPTNHSGELSPNGDYFTYITNVNNSSTLEFVDLQTMNVMTALVLENGLDIEDYQWLTNNVIYLHVRNRKSTKRYLLTVFPPKNESGKSIRTEAKLVSDGYIVDRLRNDPAYVLYSRIIRTDDEVSQKLYRIRMDRLKSGKFLDDELIESAPSNLRRYGYDNHKNRLIGSFYNEENEAIELKYKSLTNGKWKDLLSYKNFELSIRPIGFINDEELAVLTEKDSDKIGLYSFNIRRQELSELLYEHERYDLTDANLSESGEVVFVEFVQGGLPVREWLNSYSHDIAKNFKFPLTNGIARAVDSHLPSGTILVFEHGPNNPGKYFVYNSDEDKLTEIVSMYPALDHIQYPTHDVFKVTAPDDANIEAYLTRPTGLDHNTLLVMPHGGPVGVRDYNLFNANIQYLANRGFSILRVNFRGSKGFGKAFKNQGRGQFGQQIEADISLVVDNVLQNNEFDNVCSIGSSYGAYSSFMLAIKHPEIYKCIVASYGVYDLPLLFNVSNHKSGDEYGEKIAKVVGENSSEKRDLSPIYLAEQINVPILLIAGKLDTVTGFEQSNRMRYVLEILNKDMEYLHYERAGHGHKYWLDERHENSYVADFLLDALGINKPDPAALSKANKDILSDEYFMLADVQSAPKIVNPNPIKKISFFNQSSELGNSTATFNLAVNYQLGIDVKKDIEQSIKLYRQSAEQGFYRAYTRLAQLYLGITESYKNDELALSNLKLVMDNKPSYTDENLLALFYCTAGNQHKSLEKCKEKFKNLIDRKSNQGDDLIFYRHFSLALIYGNFTEQERIDFTEFAINMLDIDDPVFEIDIVEEGMGIYEQRERYGLFGRYENVSARSIADLVEKADGQKAFIGLKYKLDVPGIGSVDENSFVIVLFEEFDETGERVKSIVKTKIDSSRQLLVDRLQVNTHKAGHRYKYTIYDITGEVKHVREYE